MTSVINRRRGKKWHPQRDSNPCYQDENLVSWASRRWGPGNQIKKKITVQVIFESQSGVPTGIRTPVTRMKTWCPRPLDDGDIVYRYVINISHSLKNASNFLKLFDNFLHISEKR